jgi:hypothetical protein
MKSVDSPTCDPVSRRDPSRREAGRQLLQAMNFSRVSLSFLEATIK